MDITEHRWDQGILLNETVNGSFARFGSREEYEMLMSPEQLFPLLKALEHTVVIKSVMANYYKRSFI